MRDKFGSTLAAQLMKVGISVVYLILGSAVSGQLQWRDRHMEPLTNLVDIAYHDGLYVAVGSRSSFGYIHTTADPTSQEWTEYPLYQPAQFNAIPMAVAHFGGAWIITEFSGLAAITTDFENFERVSTGTTFEFSQLREIGGRLYSPGRNGVTSTSNGRDWQFVEITPAPQFVDFTDIAYGAGLFVIVGRSSGQGVLYTSGNGTDWTPVYTSADGIPMIYSVEFSDGKFMATGNNGLLMTSGNGSDWSVISPSGLVGVQFYVRMLGETWSIGGVSLTYSSASGDEFVEDAMVRPVGRWGGIYKAIDTGALRVAVGQNGMVFTEGEPPEPPEFVSIPMDLLPMTPGIRWFVRVSAVAYPNDIKFFWTWEGETVEHPASGSTTRSSHFPIDIPGQDSVISVEARSSGGSAFSGDIPIRVAVPNEWDDWTEYPEVIDSAYRFQTVSAYGNGRYVVAYNGNPSASTPAGVAWSEDGITWQTVQLTETHYVSAVKFLNGRFVASTYNGTVHFSEDGEAWTEGVQVVTTGGEHGRNLPVLGFAGGYYFAGGSLLYRSADLVEWTTVGNNELSNLRYLVEIDGALHGLRFSASATLTQWMTTDGETWEPSWVQLPMANSLQGFAYGNGLLVTGGMTGSDRWLASSTDFGRTWDFNYDFSSDLGNGPLQFSNGTFLIGTNQTSTDWVNWTRRSGTNGSLIIGGPRPLIAVNQRVYLGVATVFNPVAEAVPLGDNWFSHPWLGMFHSNPDGWLYHYLHGWLWLADHASQGDGSWFFSLENAVWQWISSLVGYRFVYDSQSGSWTHFPHD